MILKSPARKSVLLLSYFEKKIFWKRFELYLGLYQVDLYTILIIMFLEWSLIISLDRDSISLQFILRSTRILCRSESLMNIAFPPPLLFFLIWCTGFYPSSWKNKFFLRLLSLVLVSERQIMLKLTFNEL